MKSAVETSEAPVKCQAPESPWIQITFTLDPAHYKLLWQRAEEKHQTIPNIVRDSMISFLTKPRGALQKIKLSSRQNAEDLL